MVTVVHIITQLELGGAQQNTLYTLENLDRRRYRPVLIAGVGGPLAEDAESIRDVGKRWVKELVRNIRPVKDVTALVKLFLAIREVRPDIVHTHSSKAGILGRFAAYLAGVPVIVHTVHGYGFNDDQGWLRRGLFVSLEKLASRATACFIAVAEDNVAKGVKEKIFDEGRAVVIRSGIDTGYFGTVQQDPREKRSELGLPEDAPVVAMVSCLKPQKAPLDFVRVAARVLESVPGAHFLQAGDGELRDEVLDEARRLGIAGQYHLLGWHRDVREIIHASDVIVLTSLWEGLPRVLPQAMAAGKPIVATAVDGTPEAVRDGVNGFLAGPHDVELMADRVSLLLKDRGLARRMGEAGRSMTGEFDEKTMLRDIENLYERLLKEAGCGY